MGPTLNHHRPLHLTDLSSPVWSCGKKNYPKSGHGFLSIPESIVLITLQMGSYRIKYRLFSEHLKALPIITTLYYIEKGSFFRKRIFIKTEEIHLITKVCRFLEFVSSQMTFTFLKGAHIKDSKIVFVEHIWKQKCCFGCRNTNGHRRVSTLLSPTLCGDELRLGTGW